MTHIYAFDHPHVGSFDEIKAILGGKGANLAVMTSVLGLPVPPGFTVSTEACRQYLGNGWPDGLDEELRYHITKMEQSIGRRFGDPQDPLLVSVRSGAPISMPGMMDTILNLGINDETLPGVAKISERDDFAEVCRTRFESMYRDIVGVEEVPSDPFEQLRGAVEAVFSSWNGDRARHYRRHEGIPEDLGTGVTIQSMVFGNRGPRSATGVVFTRNPATGERELYGDILFNAQGEDVVAGTHATHPISYLDERAPEVANELRAHADRLERHYADVCDIEFTIEAGKLWMLQTRIGKRSPQAALRIAVEMSEDPDFPLTRDEAVARVAKYLVDPPTSVQMKHDDAEAATAGLGASPGIATGRIATTPDAAVEASEQGQSVILVRKETSPDDVHGMAASAGILTSTGGLASHAAVIARGWGIPAVVGAEAVKLELGAVMIGEHSLVDGDSLTIDGGTGEVFIGEVVGEAEIVPEARQLLAWAEELGIDITREETEEIAVDSTRGSEVTTEQMIRLLAIKGFAMPDALAEIFQSDEESVSALLDQMAADGIATTMGPMFTLSDDGKAIGKEYMEADKETWGLERANAALDSFIGYDNRVKEIVTAWQMREVEGELVLNDHTDEEHDGRVLEDLAALHEGVETWFGHLADELPRLDSYILRLDRAAGLVADGNHEYIASPRLDSYHNVWFELHEDLILLAGRTREDEVASGRA